MRNIKAKSLLYKDEIVINDNVKIRIPTVGEVLSNEDSYYSLVSMLTSMPIDMMVGLDDIGIDFTTINEYDLFLLLFGTMKDMDTSLVFGNLDLSLFKPAINEQTDMVVMIDTQHDITIDRAIYGEISYAMRKIHNIKKDIRQPGGDETRKYMIDRERKRLKRKQRQRENEDSQLQELIVAMVNTEQFKYNYETVKDLTIFQFNECVHQIINKIDYDNRMHGIYAGTVSAKDLKQDDLNWLKHK